MEFKIQKDRMKNLWMMEKTVIQSDKWSPHLEQFW